MLQTKHKEGLNPIVKRVKIEKADFIRTGYIRKSLQNAEQFLRGKKKEIEKQYQNGEINRGLFIHKKLILEGQIKQCGWFLYMLGLHPTCHPNPLEWKEKGLKNDFHNSLEINVLQTIDNQPVTNVDNFFSKMFGNIK